MGCRPHGPIDQEIIERNAEPKLDPALDALNSANGSHYSTEFKARYFAAQAQRMNKLIDIAQAKHSAMRAGAYRYSDDDYLPIVQSSGWRLMQSDVSIHQTTARRQRLLKNDGSIAQEIVGSVRVPASTPPGNSFSNTRMLTVRSFLSANAIRSDDSMDKIDWCSPNNSVPCAVQSISVPILIAPVGGYMFVRDNEIHYELAKSKDKEFIVIEGAVHSQRPCTACEKTPGQYSNTVENFYNYTRDWMNARFQKAPAANAAP